MSPLTLKVGSWKSIEEGRKERKIEGLKEGKTDRVRIRNKMFKRHEIGQVDIQGSWDLMYIRVDDTEPTIKVNCQFSVYHSVIANLWCHFIQGHMT